MTDRVAEGVLKSIIAEGHKVIDNPVDYEARANVMWAATLAHNGVCGTGRVEDWSSHFIEHELSAVYDVAHGAGLAVVVPAWMRYVAERNVGRVAQFARRVMDVTAADDRTAALEGIERLRSFYHGIGMPLSFTELGIEQPDIPRLVEKLHEHKGNPIGNYVKLGPEDTDAIYRLMY